MPLTQCVEVKEAEHAVSQTKFGPFMLKQKLKRLEMMASTVLVPPWAAPMATSFGILPQSSLSLPTAHPACTDLRLVTFFVKPIIARLCAPVSKTNLWTGSMPAASITEISKCLLSNISTPSQKDMCREVVCQDS